MENEMEQKKDGGKPARWKGENSEDVRQKDGT